MTRWTDEPKRPNSSDLLAEIDAAAARLADDDDLTPNDVAEGNVWPDEELDEETPAAPAEPMHKARRRWAETSRRYGMDPWLFR